MPNIGKKGCYMLDQNGKPLVFKVGGGDFSPLPPDKYVCQCVKVEVKTEPNPYNGGEMETKLNFQFALIDDKKEDEKGNSLRGRYLWKRTSLAINEKSWLYKIMSAVLGRAPTTDEMNSFDPETMVVGKRVDCLVEQKPSKDGSKIYSNIISFSKASAKGCMGNELVDFDYQAAVQKSLEKKSQAVPASKEDVDDFIAGLEKDQK